MLTFITLLLALVLDQLLGEPRRWHPLVGFGYWANKVEHFAFKWIELFGLTGSAVRMMGIVSLAVVVLPLIVVLFLLFTVLEINSLVGFIAAVLMLYLTLGAKSLKQHAIAVAEPMAAKDLITARQYLSYIVSRDTLNLDETEVVKGTIESVLENGADAIFGAIFWFLVAGIPGVVCYRLINTMDAMWGYRNERYFYFGWAAARLDDVVNYIPSRLCAFVYACVGQYHLAIECWQQQAKKWDSPNAGPVMASGAGALNIILGGDAIYHGEVHHRPVLGVGNTVGYTDIYRAIKLVERGILVWLSVTFVLAGVGVLV